MRSPKSSAARRCASEATTTMRAGADCRSLPRSRFVSRKGARWFTAKVRSYPSTLRARGGEPDAVRAPGDEADPAVHTGEHVGEASARRVQAAIDQLLKAREP